jgi:cytochrome P450
MSITNPTRYTARHNHELPPTAPLPAILQTLACRWWPFAYLEWCRDRLGNRFTVYPLDMPPLVFLSDPADIRAIMTAPTSVLYSGAGGTILAPLFGEDSFVLREGDEHLNVRRAIMPAFNRSVAQEQADRVASIAASEIALWPVDTRFPLQPHLRVLTLKLVLLSVLDEDKPTLEALLQRLLAMLSVMSSPVLQQPRLRNLPGWHKTWRRFTQDRQQVHELLLSLIDRRRHSDHRRGDMLDLLLAAQNPDGSPLSDREVRDSFVSVVIAGHETTTAQLGWAFQLLAHNQTVQGRLAEEVIDGRSGENYMTATIQETLRRGPVFLFAPPRAVAQPIEIGGWTYRPPAQLAACVYLMHHDPTLYPDPHAFCPERFLHTRPPTGAWLPWGGGRKHCPGRHFALVVMQAILGAVLLRRHVLPASTRIEHPRWRSAILTPHAGSRVILRVHRSSSPTNKRWASR